MMKTLQMMPLMMQTRLTVVKRIRKTLKKMPARKRMMQILMPTKMIQMRLQKAQMMKRHQTKMKIKMKIKTRPLFPV